MIFLIVSFFSQHTSVYCEDVIKRRTIMSAITNPNMATIGLRITNPQPTYNDLPPGFERVVKDLTGFQLYEVGNPEAFKQWCQGSSRRADFCGTMQFLVGRPVDIQWNGARAKPVIAIRKE